jgi:hypothetical protein
MLEIQGRALSVPGQHSTRLKFTYWVSLAMNVDLHPETRKNKPSISGTPVKAREFANESLGALQVVGPLIETDPLPVPKWECWLKKRLNKFIETFL